MLKITRFLTTMAIACCCLFDLMGQSEQVLQTLQLEDGAQSPSASIDDMYWLAGTWKGEGLGAQVEEVWSSPAAGGMMGMFQMHNDSSVAFYELCQIVEHEGSLVLRLKHFDKGLKGWEEKDDVVEFPLVKLEGEKAWFDGLTYERVGDTLRAFVVLQEGDQGEVTEGSFEFQRY